VSSFCLWSRHLWREGGCSSRARTTGRMRGQQGEADQGGQSRSPSGDGQCVSADYLAAVAELGHQIVVLG
jgi:hypothetical protein